MRKAFAFESLLRLRNVLNVRLIWPPSKWSAAKKARSLGRWRPFAVGFAFGALCFLIAVMLSRFLGYPSSGPLAFWLCLVPAGTIVLLRRSGFGDAAKKAPRFFRVDRQRG